MKKNKKKGDKADITTLLTDIASLGNMMCKEYKIVSTADIQATSNN